MSVVERIKRIMEQEARSCSMDFGRVTPEYVYKMLGGSIAIEDISIDLTELRKQGFMNM